MIDVDGEVFVNCKKAVTVINLQLTFIGDFAHRSRTLCMGLRAFEFLILY